MAGLILSIRLLKWNLNIWTCKFVLLTYLTLANIVLYVMTMICIKKSINMLDFFVTLNSSLTPYYTGKIGPKGKNTGLSYFHTQQIILLPLAFH